MIGEEPPRYLIGTSGWVYGHWRGRFYPEELPSQRWLEHYARHFDTTEINNTFYRLPAEGAVDRWREQVPPGFTFAVKVSRYLSHIRRLLEPEEPLARFLSVADHLWDRLGPLLVQLPSTFHGKPENLERLALFLRALPSDRNFAMEFRHPSWFQPEVYRVLEERGVALAWTSDPRRPTALEATADFVYVRFHGPRDRRHRGNYPREELREWARKIAGHAEGRPAYIYFNNDYRGHAVHNAEELRDLLGVPAIERR
jgi:uncharacterized protein YecE (DUF72 family)